MTASSVPSDVSKAFDCLLGGTIAAGAAVLKANSQRTRSFDIGDKRLMIEDVSDYQAVQLPYLFKVAVQERSQRGTEHETLTAYVEMDPKSGDITEVVDGSARDERGNLEWEEADEALRGELFGVLREASIKAREAA